MRERKKKRLRVKTTGVCLTSLVQMLCFLRRSLRLAESCVLITVVASSVAVFLAHTGNSSTPGSQEMVLAALVMAALLLSCMVETAEPLAGSVPPTPGWPLMLYISMYPGRKLTSLGQGMAELVVLSRTCSGQLRLKENQEGEVSHSLKRHTTYGNAKRWQSQGEGLNVWPL